ncbi:seven in absentia protein family domain-containing protein [Phthorimaea operculella]|nr:seven in absentia protein family domain-containing protein [Phthorimaea operculella]
MGERRENMKKSLGITEYPWSSDDEDTENAGGSEQHTEADNGRPSVADNPGTRQESMNGASSSSGREAPRMPSLFWSVPSTSRRAPTFTLHRRDDVPLSLVSRPQPSPGGEHASADLQKILTFHKVQRARQNGTYRPRPPPGVRQYHAHAITLRRHPSSESRSSSNRYMPTDNLSMAQRRARTMAAIASFNDRNVSVQDYHDALLRCDLAQALRSSYEQPSTSHTAPADPPPLQPAGHAAPHDVIRSLDNSHINNVAPNMEPVNLSHPDDGFLEEEHGLEREELPPVDERNEMAAEYEDETPAEANESGNTVTVENPADDTIDTTDGGEAAMSLEEVVEIDAETDRTAPPAQAETEEVAANTSAAINEIAVVLPHRHKRKRESDDDNNERGTVKEFNQSLLRLLECPVCLEWMEPPMWQCRRGHLVCGRCRARLAACPVCRTGFSSVRNRAMEGVAEMLRYPCRHGCGRDLQLRRRSTHEASCAARRYRCPAPQCETRPPIAHKDLAPHFQSKHLSMVKLGHSHSFSMRVNSEQHDNWIILALSQIFHLRVDVDIRTWGVVVYVCYIGPKCNADDYTYEHDNSIILALSQIFHLRVDVDIRSWGVVVYVCYIGPKCNADDYTYEHDNWIIFALSQIFHLRVDVDIRSWGVVVYVCYIGPKCNADDYTYEVAVTGQHNSRRLVYTRATHCDLECSSLNVSRQDCFHLTLDQALNFLRVKNRNPEPAKYLNFSVNITRSVAANEEDLPGPARSNDSPLSAGCAVSPDTTNSDPAPVPGSSRKPAVTYSSSSANSSLSDLTESSLPGSPNLPLPISPTSSRSLVLPASPSLSSSPEGSPQLPEDSPQLPEDTPRLAVAPVRPLVRPMMVRRDDPRLFRSEPIFVPEAVRLPTFETLSEIPVPPLRPFDRP